MFGIAEPVMSYTIEKTNAKIGLISDTHGLLRPEAIDRLTGVDLILHAGDIGKPSIIRDLEAIAPVIAVVGNTDVAAWYPQYTRTALAEVGEHRLYLLHKIDDLDLDPVEAGIDAVIYGHTHKPTAHQRKGVWYINPGSAGPHRFMLPVSIAIMEIGDAVSVKHHTLHC